jgi:hypothetical protein
MSDTPPKIKLDKLDYAIAEWSARLNRFRGHRLTPPIVSSIVKGEQEHLPLSDRPIWLSLMQYEGKMLADKWIQVIATQLAAREHEWAHYAIMPFEAVLTPEWVLVSIDDVKPCELGNHKQGTELHLKVLYGKPAGHMLIKRVPTSWLSFVAYRIGYSRRITYNLDPRYFTGLMIWMHVMPDPRNAKGFDISSWAVTNKVKVNNRSVIVRRHRFDYPDALFKRDGSINPDYDCHLELDCSCEDCIVPAQRCNASLIRHPEKENEVKRQVPAQAC